MGRSGERNLMKKIAIRIASIGGGMLAVIVAGGAGFGRH
jgi:hypothetical protein